MEGLREVDLYNSKFSLFKGSVPDSVVIKTGNFQITITPQDGYSWIYELLFDWLREHEIVKSQFCASIVESLYRESWNVLNPENN